MTGTLSALDDPPCPECGSTLSTERAGRRLGGTWRCFRCEVTFDPSPEYLARRGRR